MAHLLGPLSIVRSDGSVLPPVPAGRASLLIARLAATGGNTVSTDALVDALWLDDPPASAVRTVAALVSRVRSAIGADVIIGSQAGGYRFNSGPNWSTDIAVVERLVAEAQARTSAAPALAASAARRGLTMLARGEPLTGVQQPDAEWVDECVRHVDGLRRRLRRALWLADMGLGRWDDLVEQAEAALVGEPHDEDAGRALMTAHHSRGDRGSALRAYDRLRAHLLDDLGVEPSHETDRLYAAIVRDERGTMSAHRGGAELIPDDVRLVGRDVDLQRLVDAWGDAAADTLVSVVLSGPLGSGRTRLLAALGDIVERTGGRVLRATSAEGERSLFLHPILSMISTIILSTAPDVIPDLLGPRLGTAAELVPELREVCTVGPYQRAVADLEHRRALQTVAHVISATAARQPVLMVFDDLHHAGSSTVDALLWLIRELPAIPLMIVASVQSDQRDPLLIELIARSRHVELRPLGEERVAALAREAGFPDDAAFVWELTRGHLLFVVSVLDALRRCVPRDEIPDSLLPVVLHGVRRVHPDVRQVLEVASVVGPSFDLTTLGLITRLGSAELIPMLESAIAASLIEARDNVYAFSNQAIQKALYESISGPVRQQHHRWLADLFSDRPEPRAWHLQQAGETGEAARAWLDAARLAERAFSNVDAVQLFSHAAVTAAASNDSGTLGAALIGRGVVHTELGNYTLATADHLEAERLAISTGDRSQRARAVERLGWTAYYERDVITAIARAEEAVGMPGAHPSAWVLLGRIKHWSGDAVASADAYRRALGQIGETDDAVRASALSCLGALLAHGDRYSEAIDVLDEAIAVCHQIGAFRPLLRALFFDGLARANQGDLAGALTTFETKGELLDRYGVPFYRARTNTCLAWIWREVGDLGRARALSEQAIEESREVDEGELQVEQELHALCSLADCAIGEATLDSAAEHLAVARSLLGQWLPFRWRAELRVVELECRIGLADPELLLVAGRDRGSAKYEAIALHLLGMPDEALRVAAVTESQLLLAEVAPDAEARAATDRLATRLPRHLRESFGTRGRLARLRQQ